MDLATLLPYWTPGLSCLICLPACLPVAFGATSTTATRTVKNSPLSRRKEGRKDVQKEQRRCAVPFETVSLPPLKTWNKPGPTPQQLHDTSPSPPAPPFRPCQRSSSNRTDSLRVVIVKGTVSSLVRSFFQTELTDCTQASTNRSIDLATNQPAIPSLDQSINQQAWISQPVEFSNHVKPRAKPTTVDQVSVDEPNSDSINPQALQHRSTYSAEAHTHLHNTSRDASFLVETHACYHTRNTVPC